MNSHYYIKIGKLYLEYIDLDQYCGNTSFIYEMKLSIDTDSCISFDDIREAENVGYILEDILGREVTIEERK